MLSKMGQSLACSSYNGWRSNVALKGAAASFRCEEMPRPQNGDQNDTLAMPFPLLVALRWTQAKNLKRVGQEPVEI